LKLQSGTHSGTAFPWLETAENLHILMRGKKNAEIDDRGFSQNLNFSLTLLGIEQ
jgi:hypothetical protein